MTEPAYTVTGTTGPWEIVVGLEVHAQVTAASKLFSGAAASFGAEPNTQVSLVDAAMPGMLPVLNGECVRQAVRTGLALGAEIHRFSRFDRKNYFYADLPQGYQITQLYHPIVGEGALTVEPDGAAPKSIGIERIHLEQDAGKSVHDGHATMTYVDLNRSGCALMEIVSKPDMRSPAEAGAYVRELRGLLRDVGSCDGNMEQGSMRADVNVSVRKAGAPFGTRTETKNVNSIRFIMAAIEYEARRQVDVLENGGSIVQETRLFDPDRGETRSMRSKEDAHDYRYFPDPDLLPVILTEDFIAECARDIPERRDKRRARLVRELALTADQAARLVEAGWAGFFEDVARTTSEMANVDMKLAGRASANLVINDIFGFLKSIESEDGIDEVTGLPIGVFSVSQAAKLLAMRFDGTLSGPLFKKVFDEMVGTRDDPREIVEKNGWKQVTDTGAIDAAIAAILAANPDKLADYRGGKDKLLGFFVGQTMRAMGGKANPAVVNERLLAALAGKGTYPRP